MQGHTARKLEFITPTLAYFVGSWAAHLAGLRTLSLAIHFLYAAALIAWFTLAFANRPVNRKWQTSLPGRAGSAELWQLYSRLTEQVRAAGWIECGDTPVAGDDRETDDAVALYQHPFMSLLRAPHALVILFNLEDYYYHLQGASTVVMLQDQDLFYSGS